MTTEPSNCDRAAWAEEALATFTAQTYSGDHPSTMHPTDLECAITDLIADALHLAQQRGFDAAAVLRTAIVNFDAELREEAHRP